MANRKYVVLDFLKDKANKVPELGRLQEQDDVLTGEIERVLKEFDREEGQFVDMACGPGKWALRMRKEFPHAKRIIGIDIFKEAVDYANAEARVQKRDVEFYMGDIFEKQPFEDNTFDLVNARFILSIIPAEKEHWIAFLKECYRICKPGGWIQLTESGQSSIVDAPAMHTMEATEMRLVHRLGKSFAQTEMAVAPLLKRFVNGAGFIDAKYHSYVIDYSADSPVHNAVAKDALLFPLLMKQGLVREFGSEEKYNEVYAKMQEELNDPEFCALWHIVRVTGRKPA